ncbi:MAG: pyridoxamine 5'-phosphate oxidase family protein [Candidatus Schekmanbacteria bacterium]|nr:pyridoxamine 5'-phosphate oxidase family protein [Candidatus Schekmanbacteria bacterium]
MTETRKPRIAKISKAEAEEQIENYLSAHHFIVLGTCKDNTPISTTYAYASRGTNIFIFTGGTRTVEYIEKNPKVSFGIYTEFPYHPVQGINGRGRVEIIKQGDEQFVDGWKTFCEKPILQKEEPWANMEYLKKISPGVRLLKIVPDEIVLLDSSRNDSPYIVWNRE